MSDDVPWPFTIADLHSARLRALAQGPRPRPAGLVHYSELRVPAAWRAISAAPSYGGAVSRSVFAALAGQTAGGQQLEVRCHPAVSDDLSTAEAKPYVSPQVSCSDDEDDEVAAPVENGKKRRRTEAERLLSAVCDGRRDEHYWGRPQRYHVEDTLGIPRLPGVGRPGPEPEAFVLAPLVAGAVDDAAARDVLLELVPGSLADAVLALPEGAQAAALIAFAEPLEPA